MYRQGLDVKNRAITVRDLLGPLLQCSVFSDSYSFRCETYRFDSAIVVKVTLGLHSACPSAAYSKARRILKHSPHTRRLAATLRRNPV